MPGPKMNVLAGLVAALGVFVTGAVAESGVANGQVTKTLEPKPIGTATENGALLVSMNFCSVVVNTQCRVSVMTSAPASGPTSAPSSDLGLSRASAAAPAPAPAPAPGSAPPQAASVDAAATETSSPVETNDAVQSVVPIVPLPTRFSVPASAPASAGAESTEAAMPTETESPDQRTIEMTNSSGTVTQPSSTGAPAITSSALAAAAADIKVLPSVAWGALILAMAMVL
ncbi:hypothetical protein H634G_00680 [Metarhizium anisopliae BRIP 53293]|uniref:Uncharacterized protein n=1 Tax=Metarhizium anisopliae BRIP 53293 TaxID=1291518 RepID=A0A0D9PE17_METAN|nr:hypothetical protein H634G_00680 [Metarhizium anisopliae BRIP 53293]KJK94520.1 hypothetical protein H633G_01603 [Metarhizium anisopliae BRIP 53284]